MVHHSKNPLYSLSQRERDVVNALRSGSRQRTELEVFVAGQPSRLTAVLTVLTEVSIVVVSNDTVQLTDRGRSMLYVYFLDLKEFAPFEDIVDDILVLLAYFPRICSDLRGSLGMQTKSDHGVTAFGNLLDWLEEKGLIEIPDGYTCLLGPKVFEQTTAQ